MPVGHQRQYRQKVSTLVCIMVLQLDYDNTKRQLKCRLNALSAHMENRAVVKGTNKVVTIFLLLIKKSPVTVLNYDENLKYVVNLT